jgi:hypothetical protein
MNSARLMECSGMVTMGLPMSGSTGMAGAQAPTSSGLNMTMVPRGTMAFAKCPGGMKITCACEDKVATALLQNLCTMMAGGMLCCCCLMNGMFVFHCNMMMAHCKCEPTEDGVCITCASGDPACATKGSNRLFIAGPTRRGNDQWSIAT